MLITIYGEPVAKQRARITRNGAYTPAKTKNAETEIGIIARVQKTILIEGNVNLEVGAYFGIPKNTTNKKRALMIEGKIRPTKRPDWDNLGKLASDALNGIAYKDDSQIVSATVEKWYSDNPRTVIYVSEALTWLDLKA